VRKGFVVAHHGAVIVDAGGDKGKVRRRQRRARQGLKVHNVDHLIGGGNGGR